MAVVQRKDDNGRYGFVDGSRSYRLVLRLPPGPLVEGEEPRVVVGAADPRTDDATELFAASVAHGLKKKVVRRWVINLRTSALELVLDGFLRRGMH